jgi:hypothetical protein
MVQVSQLAVSPFPNRHRTREVLYVVVQLKKSFIADYVVLGGGLVHRCAAEMKMHFSAESVCEKAKEIRAS